MGTTKTQIFTAEQNELAIILKVLANPARIAILQYISNQSACICNDIVEEIGLAQPTISQHLKELKKVNFDFALVTGIGDYGPRKGVDVQAGEYKDIETSSTKLNSLLKDQGVGFRKTPGAVQAFDEGATAAMLKFDFHKK